MRQGPQVAGELTEAKKFRAPNVAGELGAPRAQLGHQMADLRGRVEARDLVAWAGGTFGVVSLSVPTRAVVAGDTPKGAARKSFKINARVLGTPG